MITIDRVTRQMKIPDKEKILGVVSDEDSHTLYFTCASILDQNFDLTTANIYINYRRSDGEIGQYMVTDKSVVKGTCTFSWLVSRAAYTQKGTVDFIVCMKIVDEDGVVQKEWNTTLGHLTVLEGLEPEGEIPIPPADTDLISQLMNYVKSTVDQAEADINSTKTSAIEALDQKETEISDAIDDKIADLNTLGVVRPNLLINSDFKSGIINQRGQTNYVVTNKTTFTIDRWKTYYGTVTVNNGFIKYTNTGSDNDRAFEQYLGNQGNDTYTLYVNVKAITGSASVQLMDESAQNILTKELKVGDNVLTATGNVGLIRFFCSPSSSFEIYQTKLEKGLIYTGMPSWNKVEEMNKCLAYFEVRTLVGIALSGNFSQAFGATEGQYYLATGGFSEKVKAPTVEVKEINSNDGVASTISVDAVQGIKTNGLFSFKLNTTYTRPYLNFKCFIDAEIY